HVARLLDGLAAVHRLQHGEFARALLERARDPEDELGPLGAGELPPVLLVGVAGRLHGEVDVLRAGLGHLGQRLLGGRVDGLEVLPRFRLDEVPADEQAVPVLEPDDVGRLGGGGVLPDRLSPPTWTPTPRPVSWKNSRAASIMHRAAWRVAAGWIFPVEVLMKSAPAAMARTEACRIRS